MSSTKRSKPGTTGKRKSKGCKKLMFLMSEKKKLLPPDTGHIPWLR